MSYNAKAMQGDLSAWMSEAARRVQVEAQFLEHEVALPLWKRYNAFVQLNPATAVLLTTFAVLGALPFIVFFAFSTFVVASLLLVALGSVAFFSFWIVAFAFGVLAFALSIVGLMSSAAAISAFSALLVYRLFAHLTGPSGFAQGLSDWFAETRTRLGLPMRPTPFAYADGGKGKVVD